jgi:molybdopterin synthase sulfur carrier subunit
MQLFYFAWVREKIGKGEEVRDLPEHVLNVAQFLDWLADQGPQYAEALAARDKLRIAVDQDHAGLDASITNAREIAIFPPVTGG